MAQLTVCFTARELNKEYSVSKCITYHAHTCTISPSMNNGATDGKSTAGVKLENDLQ